MNDAADSTAMPPDDVGTISPVTSLSSRGKCGGL
jgi:hypothetical protein